MHEEHIKNRELNDSLIRAGTDTVQSAREVPLGGSVELGLPHHGPEHEKSRDQEHGSATELHRHWDPKNIRKTLREV